VGRERFKILLRVLREPLGEEGLPWAYLAARYPAQDIYGLPRKTAGK
jgi:hypothetical protein